MTGLISSKEEFIFALKTETSQQALVETRPGDHSEVDREVNLGEISGEVTDARLMMKSKFWNILKIEFPPCSRRISPLHFEL